MSSDLFTSLLNLDVSAAGASFWKSMSGGSSGRSPGGPGGPKTGFIFEQCFAQVGKIMATLFSD